MGKRLSTYSDLDDSDEGVVIKFFLYPRYSSVGTQIIVKPAYTTPDIIEAVSDASGVNERVACRSVFLYWVKKESFMLIEDHQRILDVYRHEVNIYGQGPYMFCQTRDCAKYKFFWSPTDFFAPYSQVLVEFEDPEKPNDLEACQVANIASRDDLSLIFSSAMSVISRNKKKKGWRHVYLLLRKSNLYEFKDKRILDEYRMTHIKEFNKMSRSWSCISARPRPRTRLYNLQDQEQRWNNKINSKPKFEQYQDFTARSVAAKKKREVRHILDVREWNIFDCYNAPEGKNNDILLRRAVHPSDKLSSPLKSPSKFFKGVWGARDYRHYACDTFENAVRWTFALRLAKHGKQLRENFIQFKAKQDLDVIRYPELRSIRDRERPRPQAEIEDEMNAAAAAIMARWHRRSKGVRDPDLQPEPSTSQGYRGMETSLRRYSGKDHLQLVDYSKPLDERLKTSQDTEDSSEESPPPFLNCVRGALPPPGRDIEVPDEFNRLERHCRDEPWYHGNLARADAMKLLHNCENGCFLVRKSGSNPGYFVLTHRVGDVIHHTLIFYMMHPERKSAFLTLDNGQTFFHGLLQLLEFYTLNAVSLPDTLKYYVANEKSNRPSSSGSPIIIHNLPKLDSSGSD